VLSGIIYNRLTVYAEEILGEYQCGFRANRSNIAHIFTIRQTQEKAYEYNIHIHNFFPDVKQVLDSANRERLLNEFMILGYTKEVGPTHKCDHSWMKATVRFDNQYTSTFPITNGVRQGDALLLYYSN
jgi:hypothetical protein